MKSAAEVNEVEGFKGWLFLDYWPFRYLCEGSLHMYLAVLTSGGVSKITCGCDFPSQMRKIRFSIFKIFEIIENFSKFRLSRN